MSVSTLRIVQLNMGRASSVSDQLLEYCQRMDTDIALVQEPYTCRGRLTGFEVAPFRCFLSKATRRRGRAEFLDYGAAIIVFNPDLVVVARDAGTIENFVSVDLDCGTMGTTTLISGYFKYRTPTAVHVTALGHLYQSASADVLIALDANAFSTRWFSRRNDRRGEVLTTWLDTHGLSTANRRSPHTTFNGPRGRTNIDVTVCGGRTHERLKDWEVIPGITSSDHQAIVYGLEVQTRVFVHRPSRFNLQEKNYATFKLDFLARSMRRTESTDMEEMAQEVLEDITGAATAYAPRRQIKRRVRPPWWSPDLTKARKEVRAAARQISVHGDRAEFSAKRNAYTALLRKNKIRTWRSFCTLEGKQPWGKLYRWMRNGGRPPPAIVLMRHPDGTACRDIDESVDILLNELIPNDPQHQTDRRLMPETGDLIQITEAELRNMAWSIAPNRAPGNDGVTGKMIRVLWPHLASRMLEIVNKCLRAAQFPSSWKEAQVVPILKGQDRDVRLPKSYRPVSLLPVLGKIIEKAINLRLREQTVNNLTGRQFGFTQDRSTIDAILNMLTWSDLRPEAHVITVFLDITGAFDNLEWQALQRDLASLGVGPHLRALIADYLSGRTATMCIGGVAKTVRVTKGCPQGSILGPALWNVTMEALLRSAFPEFVTIQAYADDIAISVAANNRRTLIDRTQEALLPVLAWAAERGLKFSAQKSVAMMTKGSLTPGFTLAFGADRIATVEKAKYLGIWIDQERAYTHHVESLEGSTETLFSRLRGTLGAGWGIKRENLLILYRGVFLPKVAYGATVWAHSTASKQIIKKLGSIQRKPLLGITGAYNTTSTDALQVLAGVPPLDLEIRWIATRAEAKALPHRIRQETLDRAKGALLDEWQSRWAATKNGRWTFKIFPDVKERINLPIALCHEVTQFLSGHGNFRAKLAGFNLQPSPICACGTAEEDVEHVLFSCPLHNEHRAHLELAVHRAGYLWPCEPKILVASRRLYAATVIFAKTAAYWERPT